MIYRRYTIDNIRVLEKSIQGYELALNRMMSLIRRYKNQSAAMKYCVDAVLFHTLYGFDIAVLYKNFMNAKTPFEQRMITRLIASLLYEFMEDAFQVMGKDLDQNVSSILNNFNRKEELKELKNRLNNFKKQYSLKFKIIRNTAGAHRDKNPHLQLEIIEQIDIEETEFSVKAFLALNGELYKYYANLVVRIEKKEKMVTEK